MDKTEKLNVFFLPAWYPNPDNKIAGKFIVEHAQSILPNVKRLSVFYVYPYRNADKLLKQEVFCKDGIDHLVITLKRFDGVLFPISFLLYIFSLFYGYRKAIKLFGKPHINHVQVLTKLGVLALVIKYIYNIPYVITEHWSRYLPTVNGYNGTLRKIVTSVVAKKSHGLSAVSENLLIALGKHHIVSENICVIPNTVDADFYKPSKKKQAKFRFLHVSGLEDKVKNVSGILNAIKALSKLETNFEMHIIGDYEDRRLFEKFVKENNLDMVFFYGELYGEDLLQHYQQADVFVLFSNYENLPCVLLEAICIGLPVISSEVGGTAEIVDDENGILVAAKDEQALLAAMHYMMHSHQKYNSTVIRKNAIEKYSYQSVGKQLLKFYDKALT